VIPWRIITHPAYYLYYGPMWQRKLAAWWLPYWGWLHR
jgi:hypothetical protein